MLIKNFDCDFVVAVKLNRGKKDGTGRALPPEYFVLPIHLIRDVVRTETWSKVHFSDITDLSDYRGRWDLIADFLTR